MVRTISSIVRPAVSTWWTRLHRGARGVEQLLDFLVAVALRCASERTSPATTAKPLPCSPARVASRPRSAPGCWSGTRCRRSRRRCPRCGWSPGRFRAWCSRHRARPVRHVAPLGRGRGHLVGLARVLRVAADGGEQLLHAGGGFSSEAACCRWTGPVARGDFAGSDMYFMYAPSTSSSRQTARTAPCRYRRGGAWRRRSHSWVSRSLA